MLVLTRKETEQIVIGRDIVVTVLGIHGGRVKLGIVAPGEVPVHRQEIAVQLDLPAPALAHSECA